MSDHVYKRHNKNLLLYHIVCPIKYRRKVLTDEVKKGLKEICLEIEINTVGQYGNEKVISNYVKNQGRSYKQIYRGTLSLFQDIQ